MRETRPSGSEGGARFYPLLLPLSTAWIRLKPDANESSKRVARNRNAR